MIYDNEFETRRPNLFLFNRFKYLDNAFFIIYTMNSFKNLTVFSSPNLPHHLIIILFTVIITIIKSITESHQKEYEKIIKLINQSNSITITITETLTPIER